MKTRALAVLATITLSALAGCAAETGANTPLAYAPSAGVVTPDPGLDAPATPTNNPTPGTGLFSLGQHSTGDRMSQ